MTKKETIAKSRKCHSMEPMLATLFSLVVCVCSSSALLPQRVRDVVIIGTERKARIQAGRREKAFGEAQA